MSHDLIHLKKEQSVKFLKNRTKWVPERHMKRALRWKNFHKADDIPFVAHDFDDPRNNVVGVGIGSKIVDGNPIDQRCLTYFVTRKYSVSGLTKKTHLPGNIDGFETDVVEVGIPQAASAYSPGLRVGCVTAGGIETTGSLGLLVVKGLHVYLLSNNHVIADEDQHPIGGEIFQISQGSESRKYAGVLDSFVPLNDGLAPRTVDCAIARCPDDTILLNKVESLGEITDISSFRAGQLVKKNGAASGLRSGRIINEDVDMLIQYPRSGMRLFEDQIGILGTNGQAFGTRGDSGSAVFRDDDLKAVGLFFATTSGDLCLANPITAVFDALEISLSFPQLV